MVTEFDLAGDAVAFIRDEMSHPPAVYAKRGGGAERKAESFQRRACCGAFSPVCRKRSAFAAGAAKRCRCGWYPAALRPEEEVSAAAFDPRRTARDFGGLVALPLEQPRLRGAGLHRRGVNFHGSSSFARNSSSPFGMNSASASWRTSRRPRAADQAPLWWTGSACSPVEAARAATWSPG